MANKTNENNDLVVINLDRPRFLRYGHKALKQMGKLTGNGLASMDMDNFDLEQLEKIVYCGLLSDAKDNDEVLKLEDMEDLLDHAESFQEVINAMNDAMSLAFGSGEEKN